MAAAYHLLLYQPLLNALVFLYNTVAFGDLGLAIIYLTALIRIILFPLFQKSARYQLIMQELQPKIKKIQEQTKNDYEKQSRETLALYREHGVNPFSGIFFLIIQLPILITLYYIFLRGLTHDALGALYPFIHSPEAVNQSFLGLINLEKPHMVVVGFAAIAQYVQGKLSLPKKDAARELSSMERMGRQMVFIGPLLTLAVLWQLPSAVSLYWLTTSAFSILQQWHINAQFSNGKHRNLREDNSGASRVPRL